MLMEKRNLFNLGKTRIVNYISCTSLHFSVCILIMGVSKVYYFYLFPLITATVTSASEITYPDLKP